IYPERNLRGPEIQPAARRLVRHGDLPYVTLRRRKAPFFLGPHMKHAPEHAFNAEERAAIYRAIAGRRDMRHFVSTPIDEQLLLRLLQAAHNAPSVGLMQPWRFIRITDRDLRREIHAAVDDERRATAQALEQREEEFLRLKVEGILECGELLAVALMDGRERHIFGRRTLPQMDLASVACAIQNLWLAAYAE